MQRFRPLLLSSLLLATGCLAPDDVGPDGGGGGDAGTEEVTWYRDVLPIVQANCQTCHTTGGIGPFSLDRYEDAAPFAASMASAVERGTMPPWLPAEGCGEFHGTRRLTEDEIAVLRAWADGGALEGDPNDAPPPPEDLPGLDWVDAELDAGVDYTPNAQEGRDDYHCLIVDPQLTDPADVIGLDVVPGVAAMVHHVVLFIVDRAAAEQKDDETPGPGWTCYGDSGVKNSFEVLGVWVPGQPAIEYPAGTGIRLDPNDVIAMQVHYNFDATDPVPDRTRLKLQYARQPVDKPAALPIVLNFGFAIPAGAEGYTYAFDQKTGNAPLKVWGVLPHMHQLGRSIRISAELPTGEELCLLDIPRWDFNWQQLYMYETTTGIELPPNSKVRIECTWDNPTDRIVTFGEGTHDEMCLAFFYVTP